MGGEHSVIFSHWNSIGEGTFFSQRFNKDQSAGYPSHSPAGGCDVHSTSVYPKGSEYYVAAIMRPEEGDFDILRTIKSKATKMNAAWLAKNKLDAAKVHACLVTQAKERLKVFCDQKSLTDFLSKSDIDAKRDPRAAFEYRLNYSACVPEEEAFKPIDPAQQQMIEKIIDDAASAKGSKDELLLSVTRLYGLVQRLRPRWDGNGSSGDQNVDGLFQSDYTYPKGSKTVVWELLGFADKKSAVDALWGE
jgi:hypothetical protein